MAVAEPGQPSRSVSLAPRRFAAARVGGGLFGRFAGARAWPVRSRQRRRLWSMSFIACVLVPTALASAYYGLIAADQYVAEFRCGLRSAEPVPGDRLALLTGSAAPGGTRFASFAVVQYIASRAIVDDLDRRLDLRRLFSRPQADWPARLHLPAPIERLSAYWRRQVDAFYDPSDGTITVTARAFTPRDALVLAQAIEAASERLVNDLSARARNDRLADAKAEVAHSQARLQATLSQLREFRDRAGIIDPQQAAAATAGLADRVEGDLVRARTELATLRNYLHGDAPSIRLIEARIEALEAQRGRIEGRITTRSEAHPQPLSGVLAAYEQLENQRRFAADAYQHALRALDRAREEADRQQVYLEGFVPPTLPEEPLYPHRMRMVAIVAVISFALWAIAGLVVQSIRDHL